MVRRKALGSSKPAVPHRLPTMTLEDGVPAPLHCLQTPWRGAFRVFPPTISGLKFEIDGSFSGSVQYVRTRERGTTHRFPGCSVHRAGHLYTNRRWVGPSQGGRHFNRCVLPSFQFESLFFAIDFYTSRIAQITNSSFFFCTFISPRTKSEL